MNGRDFDDEQVSPILEALRNWAGTHPAPDQPFFIIMDDDDDDDDDDDQDNNYHERYDHRSRNITPNQFLNAVEDQTKFGSRFLRFIFAQAKIYDRRAEDFIWSAVEANKRPNIEQES
ncbi:hypothetical protein [Methylomonas rapida]|uniref:Uncharacterized protein n=1 Tax=Methylomonas rapida TaxID=2963939 RepID=A0ABY7GJ21_9GAMM|nr:hypothetical protein [Methylomonas rapida]WAR44751.1 hypothetical protein NM686_020820 [Methylomonas rapida]